MVWFCLGFCDRKGLKRIQFWRVLVGGRRTRGLGTFGDHGLGRHDEPGRITVWAVRSVNCFLLSWSPLVVFLLFFCVF